MDRRIFSTSLAPDCFVNAVFGDLQVKGWDQPQIAVDAAPSTLEVQEELDELRLSCSGDCEIRLPQSSALQIGTVHGDAQLKLLDDLLQIEAVQGSLSLRSIAGAQVGTVQGDFAARHVSGDLEVERVMGDADLRNLDGACRLPSVQGDLNLVNLRGDLSVQVLGDARLQLGDLAGDTYTIQAGGDVQCSLPGAPGYRLRLVSKAHSIWLRLPERDENLHQEQLEIETGDGEITLSIQAGGEISLTAQEASRGPGAPYMANYGEEIARQVETQIGQQLDEVSRRLKDQMDRLTENLDRVGMSPEEAQRIVEQAMRASDRETARAQEKMRRAQEKLARKLEEAQQKARNAERSTWARSRHTWGTGRHSWSRTWPTPPPAPQPAAKPEPVSEEERLMILRMLEQKKITPEEAGQLLDALEGLDNP